MAGRVQGMGHLQRIVFNEKTEESRRETMLTTLRQRIREVRQGPDGAGVPADGRRGLGAARIEPAS